MDYLSATENRPQPMAEHTFTSISEFRWTKKLDGLLGSSGRNGTGSPKKNVSTADLRRVRPLRCGKVEERAERQGWSCRLLNGAEMEVLSVSQLSVAYFAQDFNKSCISVGYKLR